MYLFWRVWRYIYISWMYDPRVKIICIDFFWILREVDKWTKIHESWSLHSIPMYLGTDEKYISRSKRSALVGWTLDILSKPKYISAGASHKPIARFLSERWMTLKKKSGSFGARFNHCPNPKVKWNEIKRRSRSLLWIHKTQLLVPSFFGGGFFLAKYD